MKVVDGNGMVLGRMASQIAKRLLQGETIGIINAEKVVITGSKKAVTGRWSVRYSLHAKGNPRKGPKIPTMPDKLVRRTVQNMMPSDRTRGRDAFRRLHVYIGTPIGIEKDPVLHLEKAKARTTAQSMTVGELSQWLGAQWK